MEWSWSWIPPGYDASFGDNLWFDWVRVGCVVAAALLACAMGRVLIEAGRRAEQMPWTQKARFVSLALADVYIAATEVAVLGTPATPRLLFGVGSMVIGAIGVHGMRQKQRANPPIR